MSIFNILLTIHILFGTICLITGIVAMVAQKKKGKHTEWGEIYHASYVVITLTAIILSIINWDKYQSSLIHLRFMDTLQEKNG